MTNGAADDRHAGHSHRDPAVATQEFRPRRLTGSTIFGAIVTLTDLLPPRVRYGYVHRLTGSILRIPLPVLQARTSARTGPAASDSHTGDPATPDAVCVLAADHLDVGGIGTVIEMLAVGLGAAGIRPVVVCHGDGTRARRLREHGIQVISVDDHASAAAALRAIGPDVIQLHSAPVYLEQAAIASGRPLVTAMHNTEIHFTKARWAAFTALLEKSDSGIAVSETVRDFHARHVPTHLAERIVVVPNAAPPAPPASTEARQGARRALSATLGVSLADDIVFVCLARYDAQKNVAGTVASFLLAAKTHPSIRFVYAGDPSDWAELRRAESIRRASTFGSRVHLLGNSDAATLLQSADAFVLNSFFEGWPVAATEAAAAGLPLVLSDVGGARELVSRDPVRSVLIANATGDASEVSDSRVRVARRQSKHQHNSEEFARALGEIAAGVRHEAPDGIIVSSGQSGVDAMVAAHADVLRSAARLE